MTEKEVDASKQADDAKPKTDEDKTDKEPAKQNEDVEGKEKESEAEKTDKEPAKENEDAEDKEQESEAEKTVKEPAKHNEDVEGKEKETEPEKTGEAQKTPKGIYFLLGNEFCERFSFYGMRTILTLYLVRQLDYSEDVASKIYHSFQVLCYFTPLFGAILADSWLGKFRTIFYVSILYAIGNLTIAAGAIPNKLHTMKVISIIGLIIIGFGTGGIKPCVSAFGGDQFTSGQEEKRKYFFSLFYFSINLGSFLSTALTPALRGDIKCFGQDTCFSLAFFVPAVLFVIALILLIIGKPLYIIKPAEGSVFVSVFKCIGHALFRKATVKDEKKEHWLEYADDKYDKDLIYDIKCLLNVLFIFIPLPLFWALFEQQGSKWVLQAAKMDGKVFGTFIKPDHMQLDNPLLILVLIPVFDNIIYPLASKCNISLTPLRRMTIGGLLSAFSFVIAAIIQMKIETELPAIPPKGYSDLMIINNSPCHLDIVTNFNISLKQFESVMAKGNVVQKSVKWRFTPTGCSANATVIQEVNATSLYETMMVTLENNDLRFDVSNDSRIKEKDGNPRVRLLFSIDYEFAEGVNASFLFQGGSYFYIIPDNMTRPGRIGMTEYCSVKPSRYKLHLPSNGTKSHEETAFGEIDLKPGGSYIVYIYQNRSGNQKELRHAITVIPNSLHILWQIPQAIFITAGEVMFSITGLEFSYSQAPSYLKSIVQAAWLLTNALGNLLVVLLVHFIEFEKQSYSFLMFAALMALSMGVFGIMAHYYKYVKKKDNSDSS
ncbi:Solute carrier family 15 member 2 [Araneus ventricosus]|uniref:Oligopeptide transporter 1 n=1 Tax=Araneus ventricosus TaxID=182803 RepID=A0A4Y2FD34_ARAVE|nr:Solute carrier family 15 member 2 [Araneus ventricosus]